MSAINYCDAASKLKKKNAADAVLRQGGALRDFRLGKEMEMHIILTIAKGKAEGKEKKEPAVAKHLTSVEIIKLQKETMMNLAALSSLPPPPYEIIIPAPGFHKLNPAELCNTIAPMLVTIPTIPDFATCAPTIVTSQDLYTALFPLTSLGVKISRSDKTTRDILVKQLRDNFSSTLKICAGLANGNLALYLLIGSPVKRKGTKSDKQLPATEFKLNQKKGRGNVGISCKEVPHAKGYTVYYGEGDFDRATWNSQSGGASQIVVETPGLYLNFVMIAFKGNGEEGAEPNMQGCNVPFA